PANGVSDLIEASKADILQIEDQSRRDRGLNALEAALRSPEPAVATAALRALYGIRDVSYEKGRFRDAVLSRLDDDDAQVRGAAAEVEDAVLVAWRRTKDSPAGGLWNHILGQVTPTREPRVRVIFEILKADRTDAPQLLERALDARSLDPAAKPVAVRLALEG